MILVTLGTHPQPMDRLLRAIDGLVEAGVIRDEVVVQSAAYGYRPQRARIENVRSIDWLREQIASADVVIAHAGPATLAAARAMGRVPVVVPRSAAAGEHVDDHQLRYADRLRDSIGYFVVTDLRDLAGAIELARGAQAESAKADVSLAVATLESLLVS